LPEGLKKTRHSVVGVEVVAAHVVGRAQEVSHLTKLIEWPLAGPETFGIYSGTQPIPMTASALASVPADPLAALRLRMHEVVAEGRQAGAPAPTGLGALDGLLDGGIQRGRVTEITGTMGAGKTALLHRVVAHSLAQGQWVAWIDARRTLAPAPWAGLGKRFVVVRPREWKRAAWCADLLLRSGLFSLVVLDGAPVVARSIGFRLAQLARERDAAFVVVSDEEKATRISGTVRLRVERGRAATRSPAFSAGRNFRRRTPEGTPSPITDAITISSLKSGNSVEVACAVPFSLARCVCAHPEIPDRRGVARGSRRPWAPKSGSNEHEQHQVAWGGIGIAAENSTAHTAGHHTATGSGNATHDPTHDATHDAAHDATRPAVRPDRRPLNGTRDGTRQLTAADIERSQRETDRIARQWSRFQRGRRRAAESTWGRPTRRDSARHRTGAHLESHLGQGWGKLVGHGRIEPRPRPALGRVAEGVG
jgi:recombination protein RecA